MSAYSPGRPPNERDLTLLLNGSPQVAGILTSGGAAVNNVTTATPFRTGLQPDGTFDASTVNGTTASLAGRVLLIHAVAAGFLLPSSTAVINMPTMTTVATTATIPPLVGTFPGVPLSAGDVRELIMQPNEGWLQWISSSGTASLVVWELV